MDNRLVFAVLFVTLSWASVGTYAQDTANTTATTMAPNTTATTMAPNTTATTMAPNTTATTMAPNVTTTAMSSNVTTAGNMTATTMAPNMTATTMAPNTTATTMAPNTTATTMAPNTTATTMSSNVTTTATSSNVTTAGGTTVETLQTNITRTECGTEQLCASEPSSCDPSTAGSCFFLAAKRRSGQNFEFALAGESEGYLAATLSTDSTLGGNDTTYVCANNNSVVQFFGALLNDGELVLKELKVNSVKGRVRGGRIECTFAATVPTSTLRTTTFVLGVSTGSYNSTSGSLGSPQTQIRSNAVDLANPNATVTNEVSSNTTTTASPATTSHGITFQQSLTQALLIFAGALSLTVL